MLKNRLYIHNKRIRIVNIIFSSIKKHMRLGIAKHLLAFNQWERSNDDMRNQSSGRYYDNISIFRDVNKPRVRDSTTRFSIVLHIKRCSSRIFFIMKNSVNVNRISKLLFSFLQIGSKSTNRFDFMCLIVDGNGFI